MLTVYQNIGSTEIRFTVLLARNDRPGFRIVNCKKFMVGNSTKAWAKATRCKKFNLKGAGIDRIIKLVEESPLPLVFKTGAKSKSLSPLGREI
jgi:hypothetical protein